MKREHSATHRPKAARDIHVSQMVAVGRRDNGEPVSQEDSGLPKREWRELMADLDREG